MDKRTSNPADAIAHYSNLILEERRKIAESMNAISTYADNIRRIADDSERRLLTKD